MKAPSPDYAPLTIGLLQKLHDDCSHKDVDLVASDGVVRAHSCILAAISEPFRAMLGNGMVESETRRVQMADFNVAQLKFIMRLLCTGGMDSSEWPPESCLAHRDSSQNSEHLVVKVLAPSVSNIEFKMKPTTKYRNLMAEYCQRTGYDLHQISFSANGHELAPDATPASSGLMGTPLSAKLVGPIPIEEEPASELTLHPPLELLFPAATFAKMYDIQDFLATTIERLKACINENSFDSIMEWAIRLDLAPIRMAGLLYAQENDQIRTFFDQKTLHPQVQFELQAIWSGVSAKRRRLMQ